MICECGGVLLVIAIEELPKQLSNEEKLIYNRVCDVECSSCGRVYYSQPYDDGNTLNAVKTTKKI